MQRQSGNTRYSANSEIAPNARAQKLTRMFYPPSKETKEKYTVLAVNSDKALAKYIVQTASHKVRNPKSLKVISAVFPNPFIRVAPLNSVLTFATLDSSPTGTNQWVTRSLLIESGDHLANELIDKINASLSSTLNTQDIKFEEIPINPAISLKQTRTLVLKNRSADLSIAIPSFQHDKQFLSRYTNTLGSVWSTLGFALASGEDMILKSLNAANSNTELPPVETSW